MKAIKSFAVVVGLCAIGCRSGYENAHFASTDRVASAVPAEEPAPAVPTTLAGQEAPAPPAETKPADTALTSIDREFVEDALRSGVFEIESSRIATSKAFSETIRDFASMLIEDHQRLNLQLETLAAAHGMSVTTSLETRQRSILDDLHALSGPPFDARYQEAQAEALDRSIERFGRAALQATDPGLREFALDARAVLTGQRAALVTIRVSVEPAHSQGD